MESGKSQIRHRLSRHYQSEFLQRCILCVYIYLFSPIFVKELSYSVFCFGRVITDHYSPGRNLNIFFFGRDNLTYGVEGSVFMYIGVVLFNVI